MALKEVIHPGAHGHLLCSALSSVLLYKTVASEKRKVGAGTRDGPRCSDAESSDSESIELRSVRDKDNLALQYTIAVRSN